MKTITASHTPAQIRRIAQAGQAPQRIDCGSGIDYGICPKCHRGHGYQVFGKSAPSKTAAQTVGSTCDWNPKPSIESTPISASDVQDINAKGHSPVGEKATPKPNTP